MKKILILMSCAALLFCGCKDDEDNQAKVSREYQTRIGNKVGLRLFGNLTYSKNKIVSMILTTFCVMAIYMGIREFCIPMNHPVSPYSPSMAGAPQMQIWK